AVSQRLQEEGRAAAQQQADAILERARNEIALERDGAIAELRREFADLTISAAEKVIGQSLDRQAHQRLIEQALSESSFLENYGRRELGERASSGRERHRSSGEALCPR